MIKRFLTLHTVNGQTIRVEIKENFDLLTVIDLADEMIKGNDIRNFQIETIRYD